MEEPFDRSICPICGKPNDCLLAMDDHDTEEDCWCRFEHFPEELLELVPGAKRGEACICRDCLRMHQERKVGTSVKF